MSSIKYALKLAKKLLSEKEFQGKNINKLIIQSVEEYNNEEPEGSLIILLTTS